MNREPLDIDDVLEELLKSTSEGELENLQDEVASLRRLVVMLIKMRGMTAEQLYTSADGSGMVGYWFKQEVKKRGFKK